MYKKVLLLFYILLIIVIFKNWFQMGLLAAGDWSYAFPQQLQQLGLYPSIWIFNFQNGFGGNGSYLLGLLTYFLSGAFFFFNYSALSWVIIERIQWFWPFLILSAISSYKLFKIFFPGSPFVLFASIIFLFNTYVLMIVGGGQMGVAIAYAFSSLMLGYFIRSINNVFDERFEIRDSLLLGFFLSVLVLVDARFVYIIVISLILYLPFTSTLLVRKKPIYFFLKSLFFLIIVPFGISFLFNSFWLLPTLLTRQNPVQTLGVSYNSVQAVNYFSFAKLENTISLLHPNWPENIFGKVGFMRPEFLVIPILAYMSLLFINLRVTSNVSQAKNNKLNSESAIRNSSMQQSRFILYFALLGLVGAFLAKGANDPFGGIYLWMFNHVPGFVMFRDPTKWYTLVAISYSVLIPFSVWKMYEWLRERHKCAIFNFQFSINIQNKIFNLQNFFIFLFVIFWLFTIKFALFGQLEGTFKSTSIPEEYSALANYLSDQQEFSRTLWVPSVQRFAFSSRNHPAVSAQDLFGAYDETTLIKKINQPGTEKLLQEMGVKYVIIPTDSQKEIFLKDRTYSEHLYQKTVSDVSQISWLHPIKQINNLDIFEMPPPKNHFWSPSVDMQISYTFVNPVTYSVHVTHAKKGGLLVFSESYDNHWTANGIASIPYDKFFNSFILPQDGNYTVQVYYMPQKWVDVGVWISSLSFILLAGCFVTIQIKNRKGKL